MPTDSSLALYRCPFCKRMDRDKRAIKNHISASQSGGHSGMSGHELDRPIPELYPQIEREPFEDWAESIRENVDEYIVGHDGTRAEVQYTSMADDLELPRGYVVYQLRKEKYDPVPRKGVSRQSTDWEQLTDKQHSTLLAWAYFPDKSHSELSELDYSGHAAQSQVSATIRKHGWMLSHPGIDTPVYPTEITDDRGELETEGTTEEMMSNHTARIEQDMLAEDEKDVAEEVAEEIEPATIEATMEATGPASSTDEPRGEATDEADAAADVDTGVVVMGSDLSFEAVAAMIETGRYEEAREIYRRATSEEKYDVRWEVDAE